KDGKTLRLNLHLSPDGRYLAHDDYDGNVWLFDVKKGSNKKIITQGEGLGPYADIVWSGDSRFIALTKAEMGKARPQIVLYSLKEHRAESLTSDKYESFSPSFSVDGDWLYFLSNRKFVSTPSSPWGDRNLGPMFNKRTQVFAIALNEDARFAFQKPNELMSEPAKPDDEVETQVDWEGLSSRLWQVPVAAGNYDSLQMAKDKFYLLDSTMSG
ncbi:S41 family peptidase, partial [Shewanella sp. 0m-11]